MLYFMVYNALQVIEQNYKQAWLPCFSASVVTELPSLSSLCLNRLCSTSNCCSPATSMASMLRSEGHGDVTNVIYFQCEIPILLHA